MRILTTKDKIWSWTFILVPAVLLIMSLIPGSIVMYKPAVHGYVKCGLLNIPGGTVMDSVRLPLIFAMAYWVILGICYYRSQGLGTLKAIMIFGFFSAFMFAIALIVKAGIDLPLVKAMPYGLFPVACLGMAAAAIVRLKQEEKNYEFD